MLAVSFIGKKFICDAHFEVADEIEGDGLKLNLKVRETCRQFLKTPEPVLATLHVSVNNGRHNDVTKCKELLTFLKEQVLPKTVKLISLKTIKKVKDEEKNEGVNLLSCIWPGKTKKRKDKTKNSCSRGYSSDTESFSQRSLGRSNISDVDGTHQSSNAGILATPMISNPKLLHGTKLKTNVGDIGDKQKNLATEKIQDENITLNHYAKASHVKQIYQEAGRQPAAHNNLSRASDAKATSRNVGKDQPKVEQEKVRYKNGAGLHRVQNEQPDWNSCNNISAGRSFEGLQRITKSSTEGTLGRKHGGFKVAQSNELKLQGKSNCLPTQEVAKNNKCRTLELGGAHKSKIEIFVAEYVRNMCKIALSRKLREKSEEIARDIVANVVSLAKRKIIEREQSQIQRENVSFEEEDNMEKIVGCEESPSFSKVWKYSQVFTAEHEIPESLRVRDCRQNGSELVPCSKLRENDNAQVINDCQFEEFEKAVVESPLSSNSSLTATSSNSSSESMELYKPQSKTVSFPSYDLDNELNTDHQIEKVASNSRPSEDNISASGNSKRDLVLANNTLDTNVKANTSAYSLSLVNSEATSENFNTCAKEVPIEGEEESSKKESEKRNGIGNVASINNLSSIPNLEESRHVQQTDIKNSNCFQNDDSDFCNKGNTEEDGTVEEKRASTNVSAEDPSRNAVSGNSERLQPRTNGTGKLASKKQENDDKTEPSYRRRALYKRTVSESQASERKQWCSTEPGDEDLQTTFHRFHSSCRPDTTAPKFARSTSCPVVSEDDVLIESMLSHHADVFDSLEKRTWTILHVHELWNGGKPMDAIKSCIELTGMADIEKDLGTTFKLSSPYNLMSRDYALFLNILQQLPSSCSMWTLDLCVLVLPKLKGFISTQHHTSHVEMACSIVHVVLKKVGVVVRRTSKGSKNKEKELKVKFCTAELKEIKDMTGDVIQAVKSSKKNNTEDPGSMKLALKELQLALGTFLGNATTGN